MVNKNWYAEIVRVLEMLKFQVDNGIIEDIGICGWVDAHLKETVHKFWLCERISTWSRWDKFSGWTGYPVPSPVPTDTAITAYASHSKWRGQYGRDRYELLEFLIEDFKQLAEVYEWEPLILKR